ncbi:MAG: hypothetical protein AB7S26_28175 [Sandaracinaceae bacterium]
MIEVALPDHPGESAEAHALSGEQLRLVVSRAFAPGTPLRMIVQLDDGIEIAGKATGSKRMADGRFDVPVRLVNLRRDARERIAASV